MLLISLVTTLTQFHTVPLLLPRGLKATIEKSTPILGERLTWPQQVV